MTNSPHKQVSTTEPIAPPPTRQRKSAFNEIGFQATIDLLQEEIRTLYTADDIPWIIGYSGGKDSTATLQLVWTAIAALPLEQRRKTVYAISTDTMVENPVVAAWVANSLSIMKQSAMDQEMPIQPRRLIPALADSFWVNLIGKGYPAPRHKFRWCTARLKISPSNTFINSIVSSSGEAILVLGTRKAESSARAANMARHEKGRVRDRLSPNSSLPGSLVYTPIEDWTNDDVWFYLMQVKNPWGYNNRDLLGMYAGASADGECPLVVDDSTPSCGDSRFGCWVCTLVDKDKSMTAMIQNDEEKEWMMPLLDLRDALDFRRDHKGEYAENADYDIRDFRRMSGAVQVMSGGRPIPGPYIQSAREEWLKKLLVAQTYIRKNGPPEVFDIELITLDELQEIRRIWVVDKHELEDSLPRIYREATGNKYPGRPLDDNLVLAEEEMKVLAGLCGDDRLHYELTRELLSITLQQRSTARRAGLHEALEKTFSRHFYDSKDDAVSRAQNLTEQRKRISQNRPQNIPIAMDPLAQYEESEG
ncbi:DNA phosphorothioation system sulfurtransferase DndC [Desulfuromonas sp. CSMB_57]|uniref:DNA phosphorothioation system sulfurtransferase DndC n=1 Tax=Desulfuromonas sp. CSMB_57 TaxID=2807629 RepID=UPI001CD774CD|nr:DNA phosphorothioation system sulfurtransferase DndC [Desulfuromonas sp. CSMB_57]